MIVKRSIRRSLMAGALAVFGFSAGGAAIGAQTDLDLIQSYVGDWRGTGTLTNAEQPTESIRCRLGMTRSSAEKVGFRGRCAIAGATLTMTGTLAFISASNQYEAILRSNTSFGGTAIGRRRGSNVTFNLEDQEDDDGNSVPVRADFNLINGSINVNFQVTNADGTKISAIIPFERDIDD